MGEDVVELNVPLKVVDVGSEFKRRPVVPLSRGCETAREPKGSRRSLLDISDVPIELVASHCSLHTLFVRACSRQCLKFLLAVVFLPEGRPRRHAEGKLYQAASCPSQDAGAATRTRDQRHAMASAWLGDQAVAMACAGPDTSSKIPPASRERRGEERLPTAHRRWALRVDRVWSDHLWRRRRLLRAAAIRRAIKRAG